MTSTDIQGNAVVASQSSQFLSIVPENGEQFSPGQKIIYNIEPEVGYIKKDSYLIFDVRNDSTNANRLCFAQNCGIHSIIDNINIYSKETGILLESLQNYSQWANLEHQYLYDDKTQLQIKNGLKSPCKSYSVKHEDGGALSYESVIPDGGDPATNQLSPISDNGTPIYVTRRFILRLKSGVFNHYDDEKLIPIMNFGGLRIEIFLNSKALGVQQIGAVMKCDPFANATFPRTVVGSFGQDIIGTVTGAAATGGLRVGAAFGGGGQVITCDYSAATGVGNGIGLAGGNHDMGFENLGATGLAIGNTVAIRRAGTGALVHAAAQITGLAFNPAGDFIVNGQTLHSQLEITINGAALPALQANDRVQLVASNSYHVASTEFRLEQVVPPPEVMNTLSQGLNYEFTSYDVFLNNIPTDSLRHQIPINSVASKALAIFTHYHDSGDRAEAPADQGYYSGKTPEQMTLNSLVFFINNTLRPLRPYNPKSRNDRVLTMNELVKAWRAINQQPISLNAAEGPDLSGYTHTFLTARELARKGFVFDLRNAEPEIRLQFDAARTNVIKANTFVFSKKIIQSTADGVQVIH